ncbi:hypothetical protein J6590_042380 [Homalodisca vitripennis]|nr:hypothetical protein J6590_042380 [Homalodisca vitripennis]
MTYSELMVFDDLYWATLEYAPTQKHLADEYGLGGVAYIILSHVSMKPVAEIQEPVVKGKQDIRHHPWTVDTDV